MQSEYISPYFINLFSLELPHISERNTTGSQTLFEIFRKSRFFLSALLVISYVLIVVIPSIIFRVHRNTKTLRAMWICIQISFLSDAFIYILSQRSVRTLLMKKLGIQRAIQHNVSNDFNFHVNTTQKQQQDTSRDQTNTQSTNSI